MAKNASKSAPSDPKDTPAELIQSDVVYLNTHPDHPLYKEPDPAAKESNDKAGLETPV